MRNERDHEGVTDPVRDRLRLLSSHDRRRHALGGSRMIRIRDDLTIGYFRNLARVFAFLICGVSGLLIGFSARHVDQELPRQVVVLEAILFCVALLVIVVTSKSPRSPDTPEGKIQTPDRAPRSDASRKDR